MFCAAIFAWTSASRPDRFSSSFSNAADLCSDNYNKYSFRSRFSLSSSICSLKISVISKSFSLELSSTCEWSKPCEFSLSLSSLSDSSYRRKSSFSSFALLMANIRSGSSDFMNSAMISLLMRSVVWRSEFSRVRFSFSFSRYLIYRRRFSCWCKWRSRSFGET